MKNTQSNSVSVICKEYFREHSQEKVGVMKAYYAYHVMHLRDDPGAHNFSGGHRESICHWCGRSREQVRWDELPPGM